MRPDEYQYWEVLSGAPRGPGMGQAAPTTTSPAASTAHQFIRDALEQDLPPALDKAIDSLSPWPTIVVASLVVTAIGVVILALKALSED
jgi:hypothetical protein